MYCSPKIQLKEETIRGANEEIAKSLKGTFKKDDIKKLHTILQMSLLYLYFFYFTIVTEIKILQTILV